MIRGLAGNPQAAATTNLAPFQSAPPEADDMAGGIRNSAFGDNLPDADILRGLAARLDAALKRDRQA